MSPLGIAWRSLVRQPARSVLGMAGVAIVGALLLDMLLLARGLEVSFAGLLESIGFDTRVTATEALPGVGPLIRDARATAEALAALPEVEQASPIRLGQAMAGEESGRWSKIALIASDGLPRGAWKVLEGDGLGPGEPAPEPPAIVVNRRLAARRGVGPGDEIRLRGACTEGSDALPSQPFRVAGIAEFAFDAADSLTAAVTLDALGRTCALADPDAADFLLVASARGAGAEGAVDAIRRARPDLHPFTNRQIVQRFSATNLSYFRQISRALTAITLFFAFLLIATLLTVSTNQRLGEVAGLRALGFARRRVVADLACESLLLVGAGGVVSLPLGALLALRLDAILRQMPGLPERLHFFVFQPGALGVHALLLAATGLAAALYPVWLVARLPIAATLRREVVS